MALPGQVVNLVAQPGNASILLTWGYVAGAVTYKVQRSTDGLTFADIATPANSLAPEYLDTGRTNGTLYYYRVCATTGTGDGPYSHTVSEWPVRPGTMTLGQIRRQARQRADQVNSNFLTDAEFNKNINDSVMELYDLLISCFGQEYYVATPYQFTTTGGSTQLYDLPADFYKLLGVDAGVTPASSNAWLTLKRFNFISRNRYVFPQMGSTLLGIVSLRYRIMGNQLMFIPAPTGGQMLQLWYVPRPPGLLRDSDIFDGFSGWLEYVIVDAAIKAMQKEESDVTVLAAQKAEMITRLNTMADNRDLGEPETISDTRTNSELAGCGTPNGDGGFAGY